MAAVAVNPASAVLETEDKRMDLIGAVIVGRAASLSDGSLRDVLVSEVRLVMWSATLYATAAGADGLRRPTQARYRGTPGPHPLAQQLRVVSVGQGHPGDSYRRRTARANQLVLEFLARVPHLADPLRFSHGVQHRSWWTPWRSIASPAHRRLPGALLHCLDVSRCSPEKNPCQGDGQGLKASAPDARRGVETSGGLLDARDHPAAATVTRLGHVPDFVEGLP